MAHRLTSRERPKSAPYLRLKIVKSGTLRALWNSSWLQNMKKIEGGTLWGLEKIYKKSVKNEIFEQCHSAEKCKRGDSLGILTSIVLQNIETNEGGTLWCHPKSLKKSRILPKKKWGYGGILSVISKF